MVQTPIASLKNSIVTINYLFDYSPTVELDQLDEHTRQRIMLSKIPKPTFRSKKARKYIDVYDKGEDGRFEKT